MKAWSPATRQDAWVTLTSAAWLLMWDASGLDLRVARVFGQAAGFPLHDAWWTSALLHDGGRLVAWVVLAALLVDVVRHLLPGPTRAERWCWMGVTVLCLLAVPALKRMSATSCPWDLAEFGGVARYVSHWRLGVTDGGAGHCFPSGHATAAFAFFSGYFLWREHRPRLARTWLVATCAFGILFGVAQMLRGAHYPSHTLWSAWLCWAICTLLAPVLTRSPPEGAGTRVG